MVFKQNFVELHNTGGHGQWDGSLPSGIQGRTVRGRKSADEVPGS